MIFCLAKHCKANLVHTEASVTTQGGVTAGQESKDGMAQNEEQVTRVHCGPEGWTYSQE